MLVITEYQERLRPRRLPPILIFGPLPWVGVHESHRTLGCLVGAVRLTTQQEQCRGIDAGVVTAESLRYRVVQFGGTQQLLATIPSNRCKRIVLREPCDQRFRVFA